MKKAQAECRELVKKAQAVKQKRCEIDTYLCRQFLHQ